MPKPLEPEFAKQLQEAAKQKQVVLISTPPRNRDEAALARVLRLIFHLTRIEGRALAKLVAQDCVSREELAASISTASVLICMLRKRLVPYNIEISTLQGLGWGLRKESREKILRRLASHDESFAPAPQPPEPRRNSRLPRHGARADQVPAE